MLPDPLRVRVLSPSAHTAITTLSWNDFSLVDLAPGKTVRLCAGGINVAGISSRTLLTIAHSSSKENGDVATDRLLVRLDLPNLSKNPDLAVGNVKGYAYMVMGIPQGALDANGSAFAPAALLGMLLGVLAVAPTTDTLSEVNFARLSSGEP